MSRTAKRSRRLGPLRLAARAAFLVASIGSCNGTTPRIQGVSPQPIMEGRAVTLTLDTEGCAPRFDFDRALRSGDVARARLAGGDLLDTTRTGVESFSLRLDAIRPGSYSLALELDDGRTAWLDGPLEVRPIDPAVVAIESPREALFFGDTAIPFTVTLRNESVCAVDALDVRPTLSQAGVALPLNVRGPSSVSLVPQSSMVVSYEVDLDSTVGAGSLELNVAATQGIRTGGAGCMDRVDATNGLHDFVWVVVPPDRQSIEVADFGFNPQMPHPNGPLAFQVATRNASMTEITLERIDVRSEPPGLDAWTTDFAIADISPGAVVSNRVSTRVPANGPTAFRVFVTVTGRDGAGTLYTSAPDAAALDVIVYP